MKEIKVKKSGKLMKRIFVFLFFVVAMAVWCTPSFAHTQWDNPSDQTMGASSTDGVILHFDVPATDYLNIGSVVGDTVNIFTGNSDYSAAAVTTVANANGSLVFKGSSTVYGGIGVSGTSLYGITANNGTTLNFLGRVYLYTGHLDVGSGTVNFKSGTIGDNLLATNFLASAGTTGKISLDTNTTVEGALTTATDNQGTLELYGGSRLRGAVGGPTTTYGLMAINVVGGSNTNGVTAYIGTDDTGAVNAYTFDLATNTLRIGGALTIADNSGVGGVIKTTLAGTSSSLYGHIIPVGASNLGSALEVRVTVPSGTYIPLNQLFEIVEATSGTDSSVITVSVVSGNPLYTFTADPSVTGKVIIKTTGTTLQPANPVENPVADVVGPAIATLPATSPVIIAINALTTADAVANAEAQLAPSTPSLASPLLTYQGVRQFQALWLNRLDGCGQVSWPSEDKENCKGSTADNGWWLKGFGYFGQQDSRSGFTSYDARILGSMIAYDRSLGVNTRAGVGVGYARTNIKGTVYDANTESDTYRAVAYIGHEMGSWFFDGSGSFGWNEYRDRRHVEFPGMDTTAKSKYNGQDYTAFGRAGFHLPSILEFIITPMASLQYTRINIDGHTEKGSTDDINMRVRSQHYDYLESGLGGKVERPFNYNNKFTFVPEAHFEWLHKLSNPRIKQTAVYIDSGSAFTTPSLRTVADSYHAGVGLNLLSCACSATVWSVEAGYDYYWRTDGYAANQVSMRLSRRF